MRSVATKLRVSIPFRFFRAEEPRVTEPSRCHGEGPQSDDGARIMALMAGSQSWVHRRVQSLRLDATGTTRWHVSLDVTPPPAQKVCVGASQIILPLAFMRKGTMRRLDVQHGGKPVSVLGRDQNSSYALAMLEAALPSAVRQDDGLAREARRVLSGVIQCTQGDKAQALRLFTVWSAQIAHRNMTQDEAATFQDMKRFTHVLAEHFLFMIVLDDECMGERLVLKYAWDGELPPISGKGKKRVYFFHELPDLGFAKSQHVEVQVPAGLIAGSLQVAEFFPDEQTSIPCVDSPRSSRPVVHAAIVPSHRFAAGGFKVEVEPAPAGIFTFTKVAVISLAVLVLGAQFLRVFDGFFLLEAPRIPSPSASIILIGPALLLSWMSRTEEHSLVAILLSPLRRCLLCCACALLTMAALTAIPFTPVAWQIGWAVVIALTLFAGGTFFRYTSNGNTDS